MVRLAVMSGIAAIQNKQHQIIDCTSGFCQFFNFNVSDQVYGLTEYQIAEHAAESIHCASKNIADDWVHETEESFRGKQLFILDVAVLHNELVAGICHKMPYIENNKIVGSILTFLKLPNFTKEMANFYLNNPEIIVSKHTHQFLDAFDLSTSRKYNLSKRELQCIHYLVKGLSAKDIAQTLGLTQRTIETYIYNVKAKLNLKKTSELITFALTEGIVTRWLY